MTRPVYLGSAVKQTAAYVTTASTDSSLDMGTTSGRWIIIGAVAVGGGSAIGFTSATIGGVPLTPGADTSLFDTTGSPGRIRWFSLQSDTIPTGPQPCTVNLYGGSAYCTFVVIWGHSATGISAESTLQAFLHSGVDPRNISYTVASDSNSIVVLPFFMSTSGEPTFTPVIAANGGTTQRIWAPTLSGIMNTLAWTEDGDTSTTLTGVVSGSQFSPNSFGRGFSVTGSAPASPTIDTQPVNQSVIAGSVAIFSVSATASSGSLTFQWQRAESGSGTFTNISGATSSSYTTGVTSVLGDNGAQYRVVVNDASGTPTTSSAALLTVSAASVNGTVTLANWVNNTGSLYPLSTIINISFHSVVNRALVLYSAPALLDASNDLVISNAALVPGTTYCWFAESPTDSTLFASGRVVAT